MRELKCLRCGSKMAFMMQEKFQKGDMGPWVGHINLSLSGGLEMSIYSCPRCGKLEFFLPDENVPEIYDDEIEIQEQSNIVGVSMDGIPQVKCPRCALKHDFDYPACPRCNHKY